MNQKYNISSPEVTEDDIEQEAWLHRLENCPEDLKQRRNNGVITEEEFLLELEATVHVNKAIISKKLKAGQPLIFDNPPPDAKSELAPPILSLQDIYKLLDWAIELDCVEEIDEFLLTNDLEKLSDRLSKRGILRKKDIKGIKTPQVSIMKFIMRQLASGPKTFDQLLELVSTTMTDSKRPDAACRTSIRKGIERSHIIESQNEVGETIYTKAKLKYPQ